MRAPVSVPHELTTECHQLAVQLVAACASLTVRADRFLELIFFNDDAGRALILQPAGSFGYFYLKTAAFDDETKRQQEIKALVDLMMTLVSLRDTGLISVLAESHDLEKKMHFVSSLFVNPTPSTAHVILNLKGDFTFQPDAIQDAGNDVIYKGVRLEGDLYELVQRNIGGLVYASNKLADMVSTEALELPNISLWGRAKHFMHDHAAVFLGSVAIMVVGSAAWWFATRLNEIEAKVMTIALHTSGAAAQEKQETIAEVDHVYYGIDLSKWNVEYLEQALTTRALKFVFLRATYGVKNDPQFRENWALLKQRKVIHGAYHFYLADENPTAQVRQFIAAYGGDDDLRIAPIVDFEEMSFTGSSLSKAVSNIQEDLLQALSVIEVETGKTPIIYTNLSIGNKYLNDKRFAHFPLWIADWTLASEPELPDVWKPMGYKFWQRSNSYTMKSGEKVPIDMDVYRGKLEDLYQPPTGHVQQNMALVPITVSPK